MLGLRTARVLHLEVCKVAGLPLSLQAAAFVREA